jgi:hypothetical protein
MKAFGVVVEELMLPVLDMGALDLFGGLVALLSLPSLIRRMSTWVVGVPCRDGSSLHS